MAWVPAVEMWLATTWDAALRVASEPENFRRGHAGFADRPQLRQPDDPDLRRRAPQGAAGVDRPEVQAACGRRATSRSWSGRSSPHASTRSRRARRSSIMAELFEPVSVLSLGAVLGLGDVDADTLRRWFAALADGGTNFERDPDKQARSDAACAEIDERLGPAAGPARERARRLDDLAHDVVGTAAGPAAPARAIPAEPQGDPARRNAGARPRRGLGPLRPAGASGCAGRGSRRPGRPASGGNRRGHALGLADRNPGPADHSCARARGRASCPPTRPWRR